MITAPVIHELGSPPSREDRPAGVQFVDQLADRSGQLGVLPARSEPIVQPVIIVAAEESLGSAMYPSSDIDMSSTDADTSTS